jgi:hypothetical protein
MGVLRRIRPFILRQMGQKTPPDHADPATLSLTMS